MTVTIPIKNSDRALDDQAVLSIHLAVAQWMRSPRVTSAARKRLRALGVSEDEIERRRRCESSDDRLAAILRLAVTFVIARGQLTGRDLQPLKAERDHQTLRSIAASVAETYLAVSIAESIDRPTYEPIDMNVGDY